MRGFYYGVWVWGLVSSACGASTKNDGKVSDAQALPSAFAKRVCASVARCCEHQSYAVDVAQCEGALEADLARELAEYDDLKVSFDPVAAESCIADYANAACLAGPTEDYDVKRNCSAMFKGLVGPGEACESSDECRVEGSRSAWCADGVCTLGSEPAAGAKEGEACGSTCKNERAESRACVPASARFNDPAPDSTLPTCFTSDGLHCAQSGGARKCEPLVAEGGSCAGSSQGCKAGTFCDPETRLCQAQTESGLCNADRDACTTNSACDLEAGRCVVVGSSHGERCDGNVDCRSGYCNPSSVCQEPFSASFCSSPELN